MAIGPFPVLLHKMGQAQIDQYHCAAGDITDLLEGDDALVQNGDALVVTPQRTSAIPCTSRL